MGRHNSDSLLNRSDSIISSAQMTTTFFTRLTPASMLYASDNLPVNTGPHNASTPAVYFVELVIKDIYLPVATSNQDTWFQW